MVQIQGIIYDVSLLALVGVYYYQYIKLIKNGTNDDYDDFLMAMCITYVLLRISIFLFPETEASKLIKKAVRVV